MRGSNEMTRRFRVVVLGGYGNFGKRISISLAQDERIAVLIAGRSAVQARALADEIHQRWPQTVVEGLSADVHGADLSYCLSELAPDLVIHTCGPFQGQDYRVAEACIDAGADYIDLADARDFVAGIEALSERARDRGVIVVSGASSVPGLSSAVVDRFLPQLARLRSIRHSIAPGNRAERGEATIRAILSYTGRPFRRWQAGRWKTVHGWQDLHRQIYPDPVGRRWLASCEVPDLELFPRRYAKVEEVVFHAGLELGLLHLGMYGMSWLSRLRLVDNWARYTRPITGMARWFEAFGTDVGGMRVCLSGIGKDGSPLQITWNLIAGSGHGPEIPAVPAIVLARKLAAGERPGPGAFPCLGLFTVNEFMHEVRGWDIRQEVAVERMKERSV